MSGNSVRHRFVLHLPADKNTPGLLPTSFVFPHTHVRPSAEATRKAFEPKCLRIHVIFVVHTTRFPKNNISKSMFIFFGCAELKFARALVHVISYHIIISYGILSNLPIIYPYGAPRGTHIDK